MEHCLQHKLASRWSRAQGLTSTSAVNAFCFLLLPAKLSDSDTKRWGGSRSPRGHLGGQHGEDFSYRSPTPKESPEQLKAEVGGGAQDSRKHPFSPLRPSGHRILKRAGTSPVLHVEDLSRAVCGMHWRGRQWRLGGLGEGWGEGGLSWGGAVKVEKQAWTKKSKGQEGWDSGLTVCLGTGFGGGVMDSAQGPAPHEGGHWVLPETGSPGESRTGSRR